MELKSALGPSTQEHSSGALLGRESQVAMAISSSGRDDSLSSRASTSDEDQGYAPGVQKSKVQGEVLRWHNEHGLERIEASMYMEQLEQQVAVLKRQVEEMSMGTRTSSSLSSGLASSPSSSGGRPVAGATSDQDAGSRALAALMPSANGGGGDQRLRATGAAAAAAAVAAAAGSRGELLDFMRGLSGDALVGLTSDASTEVRLGANHPHSHL